MTEEPTKTDLEQKLISLDQAETEKLTSEFQTTTRTQLEARTREVGLAEEERALILGRADLYAQKKIGGIVSLSINALLGEKTGGRVETTQLLKEQASHLTEDWKKKCQDLPGFIGSLKEVAEQEITEAWTARDMAGSTSNPEVSLPTKVSLLCDKLLVSSQKSS